MSIEIARGCTEGCRFCQAGMIYRPVRERDPRADRRHGRQRREEERLRRGEPHVALDRRLLVHRAARQEGRRRARAGAGVARRLVAARLRPRARTCSTTSQRVRATRRHLRARGGHAAHARRRQQERHRRAAHETAERVFSRGWSSMKLYFMIGLPTEEDEDVRGIVARRRARARGRQARQEASAARRAAEGHRQRLDARAEAAHAVPVVRDGHARRASREKQRWLARRGARARSVDLAHARLRRRRGSRASSRAAIARSRDVLERAYRARRALRLVGRPAEASTSGRRRSRPRASSRRKYLGTIPVTRAPAVGPHRRRPRGRASSLREYRKALQEPPVARRAARSPGAFVHHTNLEDARGRSRASSSATTAASRATSARCASERIVFLRKLGARRAARPAPTPRPSRARAQEGPPAAHRAGRGAPLPLRLREARRGRVPLAPRSRSARCRAPSAGSSCRSSTRRASTRSPT